MTVAWIKSCKERLEVALQNYDKGGGKKAVSKALSATVWNMANTIGEAFDALVEKQNETGTKTSLKMGIIGLKHHIKVQNDRIENAIAIIHEWNPNTLGRRVEAALRGEERF